MLRERALEPEYFDSPSRSAAEIAASYRELARVNRVFRMADPYTRLLWRWLGREQCRELSFLDLGAGDGWLGLEMEAFAKRQGWNWRVTNLDVNHVPLELNDNRQSVTASALAMPFSAKSFDVVIASQMTHHLASEEEVIQHFREAWRVARRGVFITDMTRGIFLYAMIGLMVRLLMLSPKMRADGLLSVKRSWTREEIALLAARAGLDASVKSYFSSRWIVAARKPPANPTASETSEPCRVADESCFVPHGK